MSDQYPDHLPVIVGAAQYVDRPGEDFGPDFDGPMDIAAHGPRFLSAGIIRRRFL